MSNGSWSIQSKKLNENIYRDHMKRIPLYHLIIICHYHVVKEQLQERIESAVRAALM
jgi:hypothetical protein